VALSGLLLVGGVLGSFYMLNPNSDEGSTANITVENKQDGNEITGGSTTNANDSNVLANSSTNANPSENITVKKETPDKTTAEVSSPKTVTPPKEVTKESPQTEERSPDKTEIKVIMADKEGNQVLADGTIKSKDGTIVYPDGKVVKNGKVIAAPNPNVQVRPLPPDVRIPPLTREQMERLSPEQRRKLRQIMENQRRQTENRPQPTPPPNQ
jgi:hypothetical protein